LAVIVFAVVSVLPVNPLFVLLGAGGLGASCFQTHRMHVLVLYCASGQLSFTGLALS
jgi:hypothetical protein